MISKHRTLWPVFAAVVLVAAVLASAAYLRRPFESSTPDKPRTPVEEISALHRRHAAESDALRRRIREARAAGGARLAEDLQAELTRLVEVDQQREAEELLRRHGKALP